MTESSTLDPRDSNPTVLWSVLVRFGPAVIVALFYLTVVLHYSFTPDGTYVYLQYARNLANGAGFSFNAGSPGIAVTSPLWVLLIAAGAKAGLDPLIVAKTFDLVFASLSVVLIFTFSVTLMRDRIYALVAALLVSMSAWLLQWSGTGLETSLAVILVLLTVKYAYLGDYHIAAFVAGLLTLVIPEGFFLFLIVQAENGLIATILGSGRKMFWIATLVYALVVVPWLVYAVTVFGSVFPHSVSAGAFQETAGSLLAGVTQAVNDFGIMQMVLMLFLLSVIPVILRKHGVRRLIAQAMPALWVVGVILWYTVSGMRVSSRTFVPLTPIVVIYAMWALKQLEISSRWPARTVAIILSCGACVGIVQNQVVYRTSAIPSMKTSTSGMVQGIKPIALWLQKNSNADATVLAPEAGMLGYIAERRVFDTSGLITPDVRRAFGTLSYNEGVKNRVYATTVHPDYIVDRTASKNRLASGFLEPVISTECETTGTTQSDTLYFTLYKVTS